MKSHWAPKKGDKVLCLKDSVEVDGKISFSAGKIYTVREDYSAAEYWLRVEKDNKGTPNGCLKDRFVPAGKAAEVLWGVVPDVD